MIKSKRKIEKIRLPFAYQSGLQRVETQVTGRRGVQIFWSPSWPFDNENGSRSSTNGGQRVNESSL